MLLSPAATGDKPYAGSVPLAFLRQWHVTPIWPKGQPREAQLVAIFAKLPKIPAANVFF
jgi:hypothetical protein